MTDLVSQSTLAAGEPSSRKRSIRLVSVALLLAVSSGCVHRRMTIRSDPPGAMVMVDGEEVGYTPTSLDFTYYGTREVTLVKDGYETLTTMQDVRPPWYQRVPLDFVSDNFLPYQVTNRHEFSYSMQPKVIVTTEEILQRAGDFRSEAQLGQ